jgi:AraC-like DNA-binding protein
LDIRARVEDDGGVLDVRTVLARDGVTIADVRCRHGAGRGEDDEYTGRHAVVFVRRGCFVRETRGVAALLDATSAYCVAPGVEERFDHPHAHGDDCTWVGLDADVAAALWGGDPDLPRAPLGVAPALDLEHRLLVAAGRRGDDPHATVEHALALVAGALEAADAGRVASGAPATARARRAVADGVREALAGDVDRPLPDLARALAVSPHHLSRAFRAETGHTIARHRMRLRTRAALERLGGGDRDLARVAADLGFADQSHLCRVLRSETGSTPAALRGALAA